MSSLDLYDTEFLKSLTHRRLVELERTRAKVEEMELRSYTARRYPELDLERTKLDILSRLSRHYGNLTPLLQDMSDHVAELKSYLKAVYDADLLGDSILQEIATEHCLSFTVRLMEMMADASKYTGKGTYGVLELATSTASMFSQRPYVLPLMYAAGAVPVLVRLLSPLYPSVCVVHVANAIANLSSHLSSRLALRSGGGIGALVRLMRSDVEASVQAAAAAAISLLAARDIVVQDSVRLLGGIDLLVDLLASDDVYVAEVARYCLISLRHGNVKNQTEVITSMRMNSLLARSTLRMSMASELLHYEDHTPSKAPLLLTDSASVRRSTAAVRSLIDEMDHSTKVMSLTRPKTADRYSSPSKSYLRSPLSAADDWSLGTKMYELEDGLMRKRHVMNLTVDEVCLLLKEAGLDFLDLRQLRLQRVDGRALMRSSEEDLLYEYILTHSKMRKVRDLQRATKLYDRMATLPSQGKLTEIEMRLYLAGQGASSAEISKIIRSIKTVVKADRYDYFSFWDFVLHYEWIKQVLHIHALPA